MEGQTEETFVKTVLNPHLWSFGRHAEPKIITTKIVKRGNQFKGGVPQFTRVREQILRLLRDTSAVLVSTFIDYYALPSSFPGKQSLQGTTPHQRVQYLENQLASNISNSSFLPYYSLHEFEALLFASPSEITNTLTPSQNTTLHQVSRAQILIKAIRQNFRTPEDINDSPATCPSARIENLFIHYQKPLHGSLVSQRIGLALIRQECPHFATWLQKLEQA